MIKLFQRMVLLLALLGAPAGVYAQDAEGGGGKSAGMTRKQQERAQAKKGKEEKKARAKKEKEDRKRHLSIQDKKTRKRIERNRKRAERGGPGPHRDGFLHRIFGHRH